MSWASSDQADTSSLLPFSPSPLHVAAAAAASAASTMDLSVPELPQQPPSSNGEVVELLPVGSAVEDQLQLPPTRGRGRGGGAGGG
ncbi:unnamed protein product, partial [Dibothriocephalus latus]